MTQLWVVAPVAGSKELAQPTAKSSNGGHEYNQQEGQIGKTDALPRSRAARSCQSMYELGCRGVYLWLWPCLFTFSRSVFCQIVPFQMLLYDFYFSVTLYSVIFSTFDNISLVFKRLTLISVLYICTVASLYYIAEYYYMTPEIFWWYYSYHVHISWYKKIIWWLELILLLLFYYFLSMFIFYNNYFLIYYVKARLIKHLWS